MSSQEFLQQILSETYTVYQLNHRLRILKEYLENHLFNGEVKEGDFSSEDLTWLNSLPKDLVENVGKAQITPFFQKVKEDIKNIVPLIVYVPFEIPNPQLKQLGVWFRENFKHVILIDIKLDPSLIGGCALVWKGVYKDYSLKSRIIEQEAALSSNFKSYFK